MSSHADFLSVICRRSKTHRQVLLETATPAQIRAVAELALNVLSGNVKLSPKEKKQLSGFKQELRLLANKKLSLRKKRQVIVQRGGFIGALLAPLASILAPVVGSLLGNLFGGEKRQ